MLLLTGHHKFKCETPDFAFASASSRGPATITVTRNGKMEDKVYLDGPTHTWWSNNPMFNPSLNIGDEIEILIEGNAAMRLECGGLV